MGGVPGVKAAKVVVIGAGVSGMNAAEIALGMQADVLDPGQERGAAARGRPGVPGPRADDHVEPVTRSRRPCMEADLVIGAVLVPGAKAPTLVSNDLVSRMRAGQRARRHRHRPGRLLRGLASDDTRQPDLPGAQLDLLLRRQHARRGTTHLDLRPDKRDVALRGGVGEPRLAGQRWLLTRRLLSASTSTTAASPTARSPRRTPWSPSTSPRCWPKGEREPARALCPRLPRPSRRRTRPGDQHARVLPAGPAPLRGLPGRAGNPGSGRDRRAGRQRVLTQPSRGQRRALRLGCELGGSGSRRGSWSAPLPSSGGAGTQRSGHSGPTADASAAAAEGHLTRVRRAAHGRRGR